LREFKQPSVAIIYQGQQYRITLRYLHIDGRIIDFGTGIEAAAFVFPSIAQQGGGISQNPIGATFFISPRLFRGMLAQIYIMDDPLDLYPNIKSSNNSR